MDFFFVLADLDYIVIKGEVSASVTPTESISFAKVNQSKLTQKNILERQHFQCLLGRRLM